MNKIVNLKWVGSLMTISIVLCIVLIICAVVIHFCLEFFFQPVPLKPTGVSQNNSGNPYTVLNLPLSIPVDSLQLAAEQYVPKTYSDVDEDPTDLLIKDHLRYDLERGPIKMEIVKNGIGFSFPVSGIVRAEGKINIAIATIDTSAHANVAGLISGEIAFKILPDWRIEPDLNFKVDIKEATIPIKRLGKISLRTFLEEKLTKKIEKKRKKLVYKILDKDRIRKKVLKTWEKMHRAEKINDNPPVWAKITPQAIGLMPLKNVKNKSLNTGLKVSLSTEIYLSESEPSVPVTKLPDAEILSSVTDSFQIKVPFQADTNTVNNYLAEKIIGKSKEVAKDLIVTVQRSEIVSSREDKLTAIIFAGIHHKRLGLYTQARIYAKGIVVHDSQGGEIRFSDFTYDAALSRWWVSALHWVASPYIRYELERNLVIPLSKETKKAHKKINKLISELVIPPGIQADLSVKPPELEQLGVNRLGIFGILKLNGSLKAKLDFPPPDADFFLKKKKNKK